MFYILWWFLLGVDLDGRMGLTQGKWRSLSALLKWSLCMSSITHSTQCPPDMALFCCGLPQHVLSRITRQLLSPSKWILSTESASVHFVTVTCLMPLFSSCPTPGWSPRNHQSCLFLPVKYFLHVFYMASSAHTQDNGHGWPRGPQKQMRDSNDIELPEN